MNRIVQVFKKQFNLLKQNHPHKWPQPHIFVGLDMHETAVKPTWSNHASEEFYERALDTLRLMHEDPEVVLILWTCSTPEQGKTYQEMFAELGIELRYFNENPECKNTPYGDYTKKLYFNVILDDKAGFNPDEDWPSLYIYFCNRKAAREEKH